MGENLKKRVLFISPEFYQYINAIIDELKKNDIDVTYYKWWPSLSTFKKYFFKKNEKKREKIMDQYLASILKETEGQEFDLIFMCSTIYFTKEQTKRLLDAFPKAKSVFFMWDTIVNYPIAESYIGLFDKYYSFDKLDCEKYSLEYRSDFADPALLNSIKVDEKKDLDIFFLGSVDGYRYKMIKKVEEHCKANGISYEFYMFFKSKFIYCLAKLLYKEMRHAKKSEFIFTRIKDEEKLRLYSRSRAILEIVRERQNGMSMRSIESQLLDIKMVTNQESIKLYNLYNPNNIAVISDTDCGNLNREFLDKQMTPLSDDIKNEYKVETFVKELILDNLNN